MEYQIKDLNKKYYQKSSFFLYPLLGIPKTVIPVNTYLYWDDCLFSEPVLICKYKKFTETSKQEVESQHLRKHTCYKIHYELDNEFVVYVFVLSELKDVYFLFLEGKYSEFPKHIKEKLLSFFKIDHPVRAYLKSYLYPEQYYEKYSKFLDVSENILQEVKELTDPPDLKKETLTKQM